MKLTSFIILCFFFSAYSQEYNPKLSSIRALVKGAKNDIPNLSNFTYEQRQLIVNAHREKIKVQLEILTPERVIAEGALYDYVNNLLDRIKQSNSEVPNDLQLVISKTIDYNAYTFGNNLLFINLGLLLELNNDDEIAIVIGHEIGHVTYNHSTNAILDWVIVKTDKDLLAQLKAARKRDYGQVSALNELLSPRLFESKEKSRFNELQADSIGFVYIKNAGFDVNNAVHEFLVMYEHDTNLSVPLNLDKLPAALLAKMLASQTTYKRFGSLGAVTYDNKYEPYLRSHPYSNDRLIKLLNDNNLNPPEPPEKFVLPPSYDAIKSDLIDSVLLTAGYQKDYSSAIYFSIKYQDYFRDDAHFNRTLMGFFQSLSYLKERKVAGKFISLQDPQQKEDFDNLTYFLSKLTPKDCDEIAEGFRSTLRSDSYNTEPWVISQLIAYTREENFENCEILYNEWYDKIRIGTYREVYNELDHYWRNVKRLKFVKPRK